MQSIKEEIIVLSTVRYKDKNLVIKALTQNRGVQSFFLSPSRNNASGKGLQNFQAFSILEVIHSKRTSNSLPNIKEAKVSKLFIDIRTNVPKNGMCFLLSEIVAKAVQEEEGNTPLFNFIREKLELLEMESTHFANFHLHFCCQLTSFLGIYPQEEKRFKYFDIKEGVFTYSQPLHPHYIGETESQILHQFFHEPWEKCQSVPLNGDRRNVLLQELLQFFQYHVAGFEIPKSLAVLGEVFS